METQSLAGGTLEVWTPEEVAAAVDQGRIVLVDVCTPQEYAHERIPGALLLPMQEFAAEYLPDGSKPIVLHCGSGMRSGKMAERVIESGTGKIAHMEGGMAGWKKAGLPYVGTDPASGAPKRMSSGG